MGHLLAAVRAFETVQGLPDRFAFPTRYSAELGELYRDRDERRLFIGDLWMRLGEPERALSLYDRTVDSDRVTGVDVLARRTYALLRLGLPARAVKVTVESILTERVRVDGDVSELIEYLASQLDDRSLLGDALVQSAAIVEEDRVEGLRPSLLRAGAIAMGPEDAGRFLLEQLREDAGQEETLTLLLEMHSDRPADDRLALLESLVSRTSRDARRTVELASWVWNGLDDLATLSNGAAETESTTSDQIEERAGETKRDDTSLLTAGLIRSVRGEPGLALDIWSRADHATRDGAMCGVYRASELIRLERREEARAVLEAVDAFGFPGPLVQSARVWTDLERFGRANATLDRVDGSPALDQSTRIESLLTRADTTVVSGGGADEAFALCEEALSIDPTNTGAIERLYTLSFSLNDENAEAMRDSAVARAISSLPSGHPVLTAARARRLIDEGRQNVAFRVLQEAIENRPPVEILERLYRAMLNANSLHDRALSWSRDRSNALPGAARYTIWRAGALVGRGEGESARELLESWLTTYPGDDEVRLTLAEVYRRVFNNPERADELVLEMLESRPETPDRLLARMQIAQRRNDIAGMTAALSGLEEGYGRLDANQRATIYQFAEQLWRFSQREPARASEARAFMETVVRLDPGVPPQIRGALAFVMIGMGEDPEDVAESLIERVSSPEEVDLAMERFAGAVTSTLRVLPEHYAFMRALSLRGDEPRVKRYGLLIATVLATAGDVEGDPRAAASTIGDASVALAEAGRTREAVESALERFNGDGTVRVPASALTYSMAIMADNAKSPTAVTDALYRLTLEYDPDHANANNNLGYRMLERGDDPREALVLIERAYEADPSSAHILDSYGWALHKIGRHADTDEGPGAVTLLRRAADMVRTNMNEFQRAAARSRTTDERNDNLLEAFLEEATLVTVLSHLGDALWASGKREEAVEKWENAVLIVDAIELREVEFEIPELAREQYTVEADKARSRIRAAKADRDPLSADEN
jgi:tetratricopeptide (TPR) repeat protein